MTVKELIEQLEGVDPDTVVCMSDNEQSCVCTVYGAGLYANDGPLKDQYGPTLFLVWGDNP